MPDRPHLIALGGAGPPAVFMHANGFPLPVYERFTTALSAGLTVLGAPLRPTWPEPGAPHVGVTWPSLGHDLITALDERAGEPVVAVGHSMGATAAIYAVAARPELFRALVLIEPALVGPWMQRLIRLAPRSLRYRFGPAATTVRRRDTWPDRERFLASARRSPVYAGLDSAGLELLAAGGLRETPDGVTLAFSKAWEAHFYTNPPSPVTALARVTRPVLGLRGAPTMFLPAPRWQALRAVQPRGHFQAFPGHGHLLPLEAPDLTAKAVLDGLRALGVI